MSKQLFVEETPAYDWQATPGYLSGRFVECILTAVVSFRQQQQNVLGFLTEACQALHEDMSFPFGVCCSMKDLPTCFVYD